MNTIEIIDNKLAKLSIDDEELLRKLRVLLSYRTEGAQYTDAFKKGYWDGVTYLINSKNQFPIGLLEKIKNYFVDSKIEFEIKDNRKKPNIEKELSILDNLSKLNITPRDYQLAVADMVPEVQRGIVRACTSSGKSLIIALVTAKLNKPTIIYVIGLDLLNQFHESLSQYFDEPIGYIGNGRAEIERINVASIWTLGKALSINIKDLVNDDDEIEEELFNESDKGKIIECLKSTKVHLLDECHVASTSTIRSIYNVINPEFLIGFSGTPFRQDNSDLLIEGLLGPKLIDIKAIDLIKRKVIAEPHIYFFDVPPLKITGNYQTFYKNYIVENIERNTLIIDKTVELIKNNCRPLILFKQIKHGNILNELLKNAGVNFALLSGKDSLEKREEVKANFNAGKIDAILASVIYDIGISIPRIDSLVLAGGGKSYIKALQRIGRVIREYKGKEKAIIIDFYDNVKHLKTHSKIRYEIYKSEEGFKIYPSPSLKGK